MAGNKQGEIFNEALKNQIIEGTQNKEEEKQTAVEAVKNKLKDFQNGIKSQLPPKTVDQYLMDQLKKGFNEEGNKEVESPTTDTVAMETPAANEIKIDLRYGVSAADIVTAIDALRVSKPDLVNAIIPLFKSGDAKGVQKELGMKDDITLPLSQQADGKFGKKSLENLRNGGINTTKNGINQINKTGDTGTVKLPAPELTQSNKSYESILWINKGRTTDQRGVEIPKVTKNQLDDASTADLQKKYHVTRTIENNKNIYSPVDGYDWVNQDKSDDLRTIKSELLNSIPNITKQQIDAASTKELINVYHVERRIENNKNMYYPLPGYARANKNEADFKTIKSTEKAGPVQPTVLIQPERDQRGVEIPKVTKKQLDDASTADLQKKYHVTRTIENNKNVYEPTDGYDWVNTEDGKDLRTIPSTQKSFKSKRTLN